MQELDDLKAALIAAGWRVEKNPFQDEFNQANWYAWQPQRPKDWPNCECNDKPPALTLWPSAGTVPNTGQIYSGAEYEVCGELHGRWFKLRSYSYRLNEVIEAAPQATAHLGAAWIAIAKQGA